MSFLFVVVWLVNYDILEILEIFEIFEMPEIREFFVVLETWDIWLRLKLYLECIEIDMFSWDRDDPPLKGSSYLALIALGDILSVLRFIGLGLRGGLEANANFGVSGTSYPSCRGDKFNLTSWNFFIFTSI